MCLHVAKDYAGIVFNAELSVLMVENIHGEKWKGNDSSSTPLSISVGFVL